MSNGLDLSRINWGTYDLVVIDESHNFRNGGKIIENPDENDKEKQLEQIITQKWIAMYPLGQEAWSEFRRTGYPKIYEIINNESGGVISTSIQIRRVPFPYSEYLGNKDEVEKAIKLLNGPDTGATRLWWDLADK